MRRQLLEIVGSVIIGNQSLKAMFGESLQFDENLGESDSDEDVSIQNAVMMICPCKDCSNQRCFRVFGVDKCVFKDIESFGSR